MTRKEIMEKWLKRLAYHTATENKKICKMLWLGVSGGGESIKQDAQ